jgi:hypothetical protein
MSPEPADIDVTRPDLKEPLAELRGAFARGRLTLYLGAGVSTASGLPDWNTLVATLYYSAVHADWSSRWKPYPNYLFAMGEWMLKNSGEPPEVLAGKIETYFDDRAGFEDELLNVLYSPWQTAPWPWSGKVTPPSAHDLRSGNSTLDAVASLCEATDRTNGLYAVVTTNFDCLLEQVLQDTSVATLFEPVWKPSSLGSVGAICGCGKSIFHVHGYLPPKTQHEQPGNRSSFNEIMLTEAHYHGATRDPYSWSNLCLIHCFSSTVGLIVGMSMTDRNIRRLLFALSNTQLLESTYLILKEPETRELTECEVSAIQRKAEKYNARFLRSGLKPDRGIAEKFERILEGLTSQEKDITERTLARFGIKVLWVSDHSETATILKALHPAA